jgi:hypothetical protein
MQIPGLWHLCDDGMIRPVIRGEILAAGGSWIKTTFLVDTGADRTVFSADILAALGLPSISGADLLGGVGGIANSVVVQSQIRLTQDDAGKVVFNGQFAGFTELETLDMSVLGRDIFDLFAVIVDRQNDTVCLVGQQHYYTIAKR